MSWRRASRSTPFRSADAALVELGQKLDPLLRGVPPRSTGTARVGVAPIAARHAGSVWVPTPSSIARGWSGRKALGGTSQRHANAPLRDEGNSVTDAAAATALTWVVAGLCPRVGRHQLNSAQSSAPSVIDGQPRPLLPAESWRVGVRGDGSARVRRDACNRALILLTVVSIERHTP
jgi:hypothetical protein